MKIKNDITSVKKKIYTIFVSAFEYLHNPLYVSSYYGKRGKSTVWIEGVGVDGMCLAVGEVVRGFCGYKCGEPVL